MADSLSPVTYSRAQAERLMNDYAAKGVPFV